MKTKEYKKLTNVKSYEKAHSAAVRWCHKYILLRDLIKVEPSGQLQGQCVACGKIWEVNLYQDKSIMNSDKWCAGHYYLSNLNASVRFDERNINLTCYRCNTYLHGNLAPYKENLVKKIGVEEFEKLTFQKNQVKKLSIIDLLEIKKEFQKKAKARAKELGVKI